jgi:type I restriction enzyme M protein
MINQEPSREQSIEAAPLLVAEALEQAGTGHGLQFFSARARDAVQVRRKDDALQVRCLKRNRWLNAKPEEIVRQMAINWIVEDLNYPISRIAVEWPIQMGSDAEKERADIVVFSDDAQTDPYIIFEVKRPALTDGVEQLRSYLRWTGCHFGCWSNGDDAVHLLREEDEATRKAPYTFRDIPRIPRLGESLDELLKPLSPQDLRPIQDLRGLVQRLEHDALSNAGVAAFDELLKLFFAKLYDEIRPASKRERPSQLRV